jgi:membrane protein
VSNQTTPEQDENGPSGPTDLGARSWWVTTKRAFSEFKDDNCTDWAAALTYYGVLAIFPAIIALVSLLGLFGSAHTVTNLTDIVTQLGPSSAAETFRGPIEGIVNSKSTAGPMLIVGLLGALWSASGYIGAFMRASNAIWEVEEGRPFYWLRPVQLLITLVGVIAVALITVALVISGSLAHIVGSTIGIGDTGATIWNYAKFPVLLVIVSLIISALYYFAPNVKQPKFRWVSPGGVLALVVWLIVSVAFAFYVASFGSYNKTYGALGGVVSFLVWLWISNCALLLGAQLNAELERQRELESGQPEAAREIQLDPRRAPKKQQQTV